MEVIETLAVALGLSTLAGINLYLVVLLTGLAINQGWVDVSATYPDLVILGEPAIVVATGVLFGLQFFSDKIPWVDSVWDSVHTLIRPVGGALLAIQTLGNADPAFEVIVGLLAGGSALIAHGVKAGTRLAVNASPEPVSNVLASVGEDVAVIGGLALMTLNPILVGVLCLVFLGSSLYLGPKMFRRIRAFFWMLLHRVTSTLSRPDEEKLLYEGLTAVEAQTLSRALGGRKPEVLWSAKILVAKNKRLTRLAPNTFGRLVAETGSPRHLHFVGRVWRRPYHATVPLGDLEITQESKFFCEDITLYDLEGKQHLTLRLPAGHRAMANRIVEGLMGSREADRCLPSPSKEVTVSAGGGVV